MPPEHFTSAATWESSAWQASAILGPALGGFIIAARHSATPIYMIIAGMLVLSALLLGLLRPRPVVRLEERATLASLFAGLRFIGQTKVILAAITLDMFAVLLGGATALLPIFARDILLAGPSGLGWLPRGARDRRHPGRAA